MRKQIRDIEVCRTARTYLHRRFELISVQTKFLPGIDALIAAVSKKFSAAFQRESTLDGVVDGAH